MGASQSAQNAGGFRIFKVNRNSPAELAGLELFFDYVVEIDGIQLMYSTNEVQQLFFTKISESVNKQLKMVVFNVRTRTFRDVWVVPSKWGGTGLLGATVRYDLFENAITQGLRVLEVFPNSPADHAHLVPFKDYILGSNDSMFKDLDELIEAINNCINRDLTIFVYNAGSETIREVHIVPNNNWGGEGCLGCDIGTGYLHRIPLSYHESPNEVKRPAATSVDRNDVQQIAMGGANWQNPANTMNPHMSQYYAYGYPNLGANPQGYACSPGQLPYQNGFAYQGYSNQMVASQGASTALASQPNSHFTGNSALSVPPMGMAPMTARTTGASKLQDSYATNLPAVVEVQNSGMIETVESTATITNGRETSKNNETFATVDPQSQQQQQTAMDNSVLMQQQQPYNPTASTHNSTYLQNSRPIPSHQYGHYDPYGYLNSTQCSGAYDSTLGTQIPTGISQHSGGAPRPGAIYPTPNI